MNDVEHPKLYINGFITTKYLMSKCVKEKK